MKTKAIAIALAATMGLTGCAALFGTDYAEMTTDIIKASFSDKGMAKKDRVIQDETNLACSAADVAGKDVEPALRKRLEAANMQTVKFPSDGKFLGDWKQGEKEAQSGRGMTYSDNAGTPNGGNCYNCHQITKAEISYGTLGPSLYQYGKLRGNSDDIVKYTWSKIYNAKAYNLCTNMPRFGHEKLLTEKQMQDIMALLLDPNSPVNKD
ncbi:MAG: sulfur oxidation c-type cytochrome SoxX [Pseudomonadota bacterium]|jgi:sulfur-oxidizing protein SoxX